MINLIRDLRHNNFFIDSVFWKLLGNFYRGVIKIIPFDFSVKQKITNEFEFKFHARYAFSDFKEWGNKHNNFFNTYLNIAKKTKCFFDVGAHIGIVTLPVAKIIEGSGKIFSFEPSKNNLFYLKYHVKKNKLKNVQIIEKAVSSRNEHSSLYESDQPTGMSSLIPIEDKKITIRSSVESITLDEFCDKNKIKPEIIKVDIEGSEIELLKGSRRIMKQLKPVFFLSYHPEHIKEIGYRKDKILTLLDELNYEIIDFKFRKPKTLKNSEYFVFPKSLNPRKFLNDL